MDSHVRGFPDSAVLVALAGYFTGGWSFGSPALFNT